MNSIPYSAIVVVMVLLLGIWLFMVHMLSSLRQDAHLQFLVDLMRTSASSLVNNDGAEEVRCGQVTGDAPQRCLNPQAGEGGEGSVTLHAGDLGGF